MTDSDASCSEAEFCILMQPGTRIWSLSLDPASGTEASPPSLCLQSHRLVTNLLFAHWLF